MLDQAHGLIYNGRGVIDQRPGTQTRIFDLLEKAKERGTKVVLSFTETRALGFSELVETLREEIIDRWGNVGKRDLGDRLDNHDNVEIRHPPAKDCERIIREIVKRDRALREAGPLDYIVGAFMASNYGTMPTLRKMTSNARRVVSASTHERRPITPEFIIGSVGSKRARKKLRDGELKIGGRNRVDGYIGGPSEFSLSEAVSALLRLGGEIIPDNDTMSNVGTGHGEHKQGSLFENSFNSSNTRTA